MERTVRCYPATYPIPYFVGCNAVFAVVIEEAGAVTRIATNDEFARFELAEHITEHHHHIICNSCGDIADFSLPANIEKSLDLSLQQAAKKTSFDIANHRLDVLGTCTSCQ